jgi:hypothetical protein
MKVTVDANLHVDEWSENTWTNTCRYWLTFGKAQMDHRRFATCISEGSWNDVGYRSRNITHIEKEKLATVEVRPTCCVTNSTTVHQSDVAPVTAFLRLLWKDIILSVVDYFSR